MELLEGWGVKYVVYQEMILISKLGCTTGYMYCAPIDMRWGWTSGSASLGHSKGGHVGQRNWDRKPMVRWGVGRQPK